MFGAKIQCDKHLNSINGCQCLFRPTLAFSYHQCSFFCYKELCQSLFTHTVEKNWPANKICAFGHKLLLKTRLGGAHKQTILLSKMYSRGKILALLSLYSYIGYCLVNSKVNKKIWTAVGKHVNTVWLASGCHKWRAAHCYPCGQLYFWFSIQAT